MLDLNKPVQTRAGEALTVLATGVTAAIPGIRATRHDGQTLLVVKANGIATYHHADGAFDSKQGPTLLDVVNVPEAPVVTERFFAVYPDSDTPSVTEIDAEYVARLNRSQAAGRPLVKMTFHDGTYVSSEILTEA